MKPAVRDVLEKLKLGGKISPAQLEAVFPSANLFKMQADPERLTDVWKRLATELSALSDEERKIFDEVRVLLESPRLDERVRGTELVFERLHALFNAAALVKGKILSGQELIAACLDRIGADALRLNPAVEQLYQLFLARERRVDPNFDLPFETWLRVSESRRLPTLLQLLLTSDQFSKLTRSAALHVPASANITVGWEVVDRIAALLASFDVEDKLLRKLRGLLELDGTDKIREILKTGRLDVVVSVLQRELFLVTDLWNLQGNIGEILALPKQLERLKAVTAARGSRPVFLASDVRVGGRRITVDKEAERAAAEAAEALGLPPTTSFPASEVTVRSQEFSDDLIVDLGSPPRMTVLEHHESKVTRQSVADGVEQIGDNTERMTLSAEISIGRLYKVEGDKLVAVDLADVPGFEIVSRAGGDRRLVVSEGEGFLARVAKQDEAIEAAIAPIRNRADLDEKARSEEIAAVIARFAREELEHRNLLGLKSSTKVLFTPDAQPGEVLAGIQNVLLGFTYSEIIDFCNLLLIHGGFKRFERAAVTAGEP